VVAQERALGVPERAPLGLLSEIACGVRAQACAALFALPLLTLLWVLDLVLPAAAIVTVPGKFLVAAFALAWNLFDYPLTLRGVRMRDRVRIVRRYKSFSLGFGAAFALLFLLPCCAVLLLPVGVVAATRSVWTLLLHDPDLLPKISRPSPNVRA
jgi:CysZ protein